MGRPQNTQARVRILRAAFHLLHQRGFQGVSMDAVADAAGMKKANLFHYFPTKEALALAVVDQACETHKARVCEQLEEGDPVRTVESLFSGAAEGMQECGCARGCLIGNLAQELSDQNERVRALIASFFEYWTDRLTERLERARRLGYFKPGLRPREAAEALVALYEGAMLFSKANKGIRPLQNARRMAGAYLRAYRLGREE